MEERAESGWDQEKAQAVKDSAMRHLIYLVNRAGEQISGEMREKFPRLDDGVGYGGAACEWMYEQVAVSAEELAVLVRKKKVKAAFTGPAPRLVSGLLTLASSQMLALARSVGL